jgi:hypothetical protein
MITDETLAKWAELAEKATSGPWIHEAGKYSGDNWLVGSILLGSGYDNQDHWVHLTTDHIHASELSGDGAEADALFIAASREAVPALIAEVRRLRAENKWLMTQAGKEVRADVRPLPILHFKDGELKP